MKRNDTQELIKNVPTSETPRKCKKQNDCGETAEHRKEREQAEREARKCYGEGVLINGWTIRDEHRAIYENCVARFYDLSAKLATRKDASEELRAAWEQEQTHALHLSRRIAAMGTPLNARTSGSEPLRIDNIIERDGVDGRTPRMDLCSAYNVAAQAEANPSDVLEMERAYVAWDNVNMSTVALEEEERAERNAKARAALRENFITEMMKAGFTAEQAEELAAKAPKLNA